MRVWLNGSLVDEAEARVSVFDHGLTVGDGVFETLMAYRGRPFAVRRHLERLASSAAGMGLAGLPPAAELRAALDDVVTASGLAAAVVRITVTSGPGPAGSARSAGPPTVVVSAGPAPSWPATAAVAVVAWPRNERGALAGFKTTSYGENVVALAFARERGASEAIFANLAGELCEGTGSNVVVESGGRLVTPPLRSGCLAGVTRALVIEVCGVIEDDLPLAALAAATEAFLTSTTREVQPIAIVDGHPLPTAPGRLTSEAATTLAALIRSTPDP